MQVRHVHTSIADESAQLVASSFASARLDYVNYILCGNSRMNIQRLEYVQNALARVALSPDPCSPVDCLTKLHWLPMDYRINYELVILIYKVFILLNLVISLLFSIGIPSELPPIILFWSPCYPFHRSYLL